MNAGRTEYLQDAVSSVPGTFASISLLPGHRFGEANTFDGGEMRRRRNDAR